MNTIARRVAFDDINVGDEIPRFHIGETQETIDGVQDPAREVERPPRNIHNDSDFARSGIFSGTVNAGVTTMAYVVQMLECWFPPEAFYNGGAMTFKAIEPFRPGDDATFTGTITGKRIEHGRQFVDCEIQGTNQHGRLMGVAEVTVVLND